MRPFLRTILLLAVSYFTVSAQDHAKQMAREYSQSYARNRAFAESLAVAQGFPIRTESSDGTIRELQRIEYGRPRYYKTDNLNAAKTISTNKVWPGGGFGFSLTGDSVILGEWDGGRVRTSHQEFGGRVTSTQGSFSDHSTHVAGTIIASGLSASAKGMSYQAQLRAFDWNNDLSEMQTQAVSNGLRVSNHSYGLITGWDFNTFNDNRWAWFGDPTISGVEDWSFGFYDSEAQSWDNLARSTPNYLIVKSAGNDRGEGPGASNSVNHWVFNGVSWVNSTSIRNNDGGSSGYDCVSAAGLGKNVLTVGAVNDITGGYSGTGSVVMSSFSSWGPTDDGRIKPDIVANGVGLTSSLSTADNAYGSLSGTSMATPNVTGSLGLLLQRQRELRGATPLLSSTLKALVLHTADEAGTSPGPDYRFGWGLMNTLRAVQVTTLDSTHGFGSHINELVLNPGDTIRFDVSASGFEPLKATICWTDPAGTPVAPALDPTNIMLKNDLDLRLIRKSNGAPHEPWVLDHTNPTVAATTGDNIRDNVEQVYIGSPERTRYIVQVTHKGTLTSGAQAVSVIVTGNVPSIGPIASISPTSKASFLVPGEVKSDSIVLRNTGDTTLHYQVSIPPTIGGWLTSLHSDTGSVASADSQYIYFSVDAESLRQWTEHNSTITITHDDSERPTFVIPISLEVRGPTAVISPSEFEIDVDTLSSALDTLVVKNEGYIPLEFNISDDDPSFPVWLTISPTSGIIQPGDSVIVELLSNNPLQPFGNYSTLLRVEHNDSSGTTFNVPVELHVGTGRIVSSAVRKYWNLVSLPVDALSKDVDSIYPNAISSAFEFSGGYLAKDTLEMGKGYWLKFNAVDSIHYQGFIVPVDTIELAAEWNIIGSLNVPLGTTSYSTIPDGILESSFFGYDGGYFLTDSIYPGKGYWVKASQPGQLILGAGSSALPKASHFSLKEYPVLTFTDAHGYRQTLYVEYGRSHQLSDRMFALPPKAPGDAFDVRFSTGSMVGASSMKEAMPLALSGGVYPITIEWNEKGSRLEASLVVDNKTVSLGRSGKTTMHQAGDRVELKVTGISKVPASYSLGQNYPNPLNPTTQIPYELPIAGRVTIKVYSLLGSEIATLVDETKEPGSYNAEFDGSSMSLPSGVYLYRMQAGTFSVVKKMLLMK